MAKNGKWQGKSAKRGNAKSPYARYGKLPYTYSQVYRDWKRANTIRAAGSKAPS